MCHDSVEGVPLDHCLEALTGGLSEDQFHLVRKVTKSLPDVIVQCTKYSSFRYF